MRAPYCPPPTPDHALCFLHGVDTDEHDARYTELQREHAAWLVRRLT